MAVDLDIICTKAGIPVDMHFWDEIFLEGVGENQRDVYNYLMENADPIFKDNRSEKKWQGEYTWGFKVWEIDKNLAIEILKYILSERRTGQSRYLIDDWEIAGKVEDWKWFDEGKKVFIIC